MNPEKIGKFIKKLRKDNNLTQKELADKYGVTYQAVSKWENGINLPDVSLIREMSKDFNISVEDILDGEITDKKNNHNNKIIYIMIAVILLLIIIFIIHLINDDNSFNSNTVSSSCDDFKVSGSIAYDKNRSAIYISKIDYLGCDDNIEYKEIQCTLYENHDNTNIKISSCKTSESNTKLTDYLNNVELNIDNYKQACSKYNDDSLYLEINAINSDDKTITYKIPLSINDDCQKQ